LTKLLTEYFLNFFFGFEKFDFFWFFYRVKKISVKIVLKNCNVKKFECYNVKIVVPRVNEFRIHPVFYSSTVKLFPVLINFKSWLESYFQTNYNSLYSIFFLTLGHSGNKL